MRAVVLDVLDRGIDAVHHLGGNDGVEIFGRPVLLARGLRARVGGLHGGIAAHLAARIDQHGDERLEVRRRGGAIDQQCLGRAAYAGAPHLGVEHDRLRHVERRGLVDIDVADAFEMREHRHARFRLHARDQILAAARHDHVDGAVEPRQHHADRGAVARRHEPDRRLAAGRPRSVLPRSRRGSPDWSAGSPSRRAGSRHCRP